VPGVPCNDRSDPWLAPDGREWFRRRRGQRMMLPAASEYGLSPPRRTRVAAAAWHLCASVHAGPLGKAALWALREP
jgi:hypothetical protein